MNHLVYQTTNKLNNKIYIGVHSTKNINDGYLGSGTALKKAVKKYGKQNFKRIILNFSLYQSIIKYKEEKSLTVFEIMVVQGKIKEGFKIDNKKLIKYKKFQSEITLLIKYIVYGY